MRAFGTLRLRLILVLAAVVAVAMGVVFLYVVPTLRDSLISERYTRLDDVANAEQHNLPLRHALANGQYANVRNALNRIGRLANASVDLYIVTNGRPVPANPTDLPTVPAGNPAVRKAARTGGVTRSRGEDGDVVVAFGMPHSVVALSQQVGDVETTGRLVERRILIATALALLVAGLVGWAAAYGVSRRLAALERAATRISLGEFGEPIGDTSRGRAGRAGPGVRHDADRGSSRPTARARTSSPTPRTSCGRRSSPWAASSSCWTTRTSTPTGAASSWARCTSR